MSHYVNVTTVKKIIFIIKPGYANITKALYYGVLGNFRKLSLQNIHVLPLEACICDNFKKCILSADNFWYCYVYKMRNTY